MVAMHLLLHVKMQLLSFQQNRWWKQWYSCCKFSSHEWRYSTM